MLNLGCSLCERPTESHNPPPPTWAHNPVHIPKKISMESNLAGLIAGKMADQWWLLAATLIGLGRNIDEVDLDHVNMFAKVA